MPPDYGISPDVINFAIVIAILWLAAMGAYAVVKVFGDF